MKLRQYQINISDQAAIILKKFGLVYLAMEVRTGKTITALETAQKYGAMKVLFVSKKKALTSIEDDSKHFPTLEVVTINYESLHKVVGIFDLIIMDEAHGLGAFPKPCKKTFELKKLAIGKPIIFLSGTPSPESYSQLYHQFYVSSFSPFRDYKNFYSWSKDFVIIKIKHIYNGLKNDYSDSKKDLIDTYTKHLFLTYTQEEAGFDVSITEKVLTVLMPKMIDLIKQLHNDKIVNLSGHEILADTAVKEMTKIQQLCGGSVLDELGVTVVLDYSKALFIRDYFQGKKIAVFYKFKAEFDILTKILPNCTTCPETFQQSSDMTYLGQFVSSREGIRLDTADAIIFYGIDFSYLSYEQSKNRIISKERIKEAVLYWIFCEGGIEAKILKAVRNKENYTSSYFNRDYGKIRKYYTA